MTRVICFLLCLGFFACGRHGDPELLQQNSAQLAMPRLIASNQIIDSAETLSAELAMEGVSIYYTDDGSEPTETGAYLYKTPLRIAQPGTYKFKAFHTDWKPSETAQVIFVKKGCDVDSVIWQNPLNERYGGRGPRTLVNHRKAGANYMDNEWLGFDTAAIMTCIFEEKTHISSIDIGYLNHPGAWIFPPGSVVVYTSSDGIEFRAEALEELPKPIMIPDAKQETLSLPLRETVKGIRLEFKNMDRIPEWHEGAGKKAWLFMDEIIFNQ